MRMNHAAGVLKTTLQANKLIIGVVPSKVANPWLVGSVSSEISVKYLGTKMVVPNVVSLILTNVSISWCPPF